MENQKRLVNYLDQGRRILTARQRSRIRHKENHANAFPEGSEDPRGQHFHEVDDEGKKLRCYACKPAPRPMVATTPMRLVPGFKLGGDE